MITEQKVKTDRHYPTIKVSDRADGKVDVIMPDGTIAATFDTVKPAFVSAIELKKESIAKVKIVRVKLAEVNHRRGRNASPTISIVTDGDKFSALDLNGNKIATVDTVKLAIEAAKEYKMTNNINAKIRRVKETDSKTIFTSKDEVTTTRVNNVLKKMNIAADVKNVAGDFKVVAPKHMQKRDLAMATTAALAVSLVE